VYVEQALFTSAQTARGDGYQLVARSRGVTEDDARALAVWGPSHGSLRENIRASGSCNYFVLPSGLHCVSRTVAAGAEYSRRGARIATQFFLVPPEVFSRFANSAFALLKAAVADGLVRTNDETLRDLAPITLMGKASPFDRTAVDRARKLVGDEAIAAAVQCALCERGVLLRGVDSPDVVLAAVINCLPPDCRPDWTFTTGLKYSVRRTFRLLVAPDNMAECRQVERIGSHKLLDLSPGVPLPELTHGWAKFVFASLEFDGGTALAERFATWSGILPGALESLGVTALSAMAHSATAALRGNAAPRHRESIEAPAAHSRSVRDTTRAVESLNDTASELPVVPAARIASSPSVPPAAASDSAADVCSSGGAATCVAAAPATVRMTPLVNQTEVEIVTRLEQLDDVVFEAIDGDPAALAELRRVWPEALRELGAERVDESRAQYLRRALAVWNDTGAGSQSRGDRSPGDAAAALEVLCLLAGS
jgi:hypothetical protein